MPRLTPKTMTVVLMEGDDYERAKELEADVDAMLPKKLGRVGDRDGMLTAAEKYDEFVTEALERSWHVTVVALPRKQWAEFREEAGPPREGWKIDEARGFNNDRMSELLVPASITRIVYKGEDQPIKGSEFETFLDSLSIGDWSRLYSGAVSLNIDTEEPPKADLSSTVSQTFDAIAKSRGDSD